LLSASNWQAVTPAGNGSGVVPSAQTRHGDNAATPTATKSDRNTRERMSITSRIRDRFADTREVVKGFTPKTKSDGKRKLSRSHHTGCAVHDRALAATHSANYDDIRLNAPGPVRKTVRLAVLAWRH
jgi:hypothetical protein